MCRIVITTAFPIRPRLLVQTMPASGDKKLGIQDKQEPREVTAALAEDLRVFAGQKWPTMNHKWRKARLASLLGMTERRVKSIYEAEETARLRVDEEARIKALIGKKEEADVEDQALAQRISELEAQVAFLVAALAGDQLAANRGTALRQGSGALGSRAAASGRRAGD